jgi:hypothetical protein
MVLTRRNDSGKIMANGNYVIKERNMNETKDEKKAVPPYVPYRTFDNVIQKLSTTGIPTRIDRSFLSSFSGSAQAQIFLALRYLSLIDEDGNPATFLEKFIKSPGAEKQGILKEILTTSYPFIFRKGVDLTKITSDHLRELFEGAGATGDTTRKSMKFFMMAAKSAGITLSPHLKKLRMRSTRKGVGKKKVEEPEDHRRSESETELPASPSNKTLQDLLLSKFPTLDPSWSDEVKAKWFDSFNQLMAELKKLE